MSDPLLTIHITEYCAAFLTDLLPTAAAVRICESPAVLLALGANAPPRMRVLETTASDVVTLAGALRRQPAVLTVILCAHSDLEIVDHTLGVNVDAVVSTDALGTPLVRRTLHRVLSRACTPAFLPPEFAALRESEARWRLLTEALFDGIAIHEDGVVVWANERMAELFGYPPQELVGLDVRQLAAPETSSVVAAAIASACEDPYEAVGQRADGSRFFGELRGRSVPYQGRAARLVAIRDISERREYEERLRQHAAERQSLAKRVIEAQEAERQRIARELHDSVGQVLAVLMMNADSIAARRQDPAAVEVLAQKLRATGEELISVVRELAYGLRPAVLDDLGVLCALRTFANHLGAASGLTITLDAPAQLELSRETATALYRIAQEALTNVARHAKAERATITVSQHQDGQVELAIRDDGCGVALGEIDFRESLGMAGMRERAALCGGSLVIERRPDGGTEVRALVRP